MISYRDTYVDDLDLRGRIIGTLRRMRIRTVGEVERKWDVIRSERGIGPNSMRDLREAISLVKGECEREMARAASEDLTALPVRTGVEPGLQAVILWAMANQKLIRFYIKHDINEIAIASAFGVEIEGETK